MIRFAYSAGAAEAGPNKGRISRLLILWALTLLAIALWTTLIVPASAGSPSDDPIRKGTQPDAPTCSSSWQVTSSPNIGSNSNYLYAVDAATVGGDVWAVGAYYNESASKHRTLIQKRAGNQWSVVSSPNAGTGHNYLKGISVLSSTSAWAVGYYHNGTAYRTFIQHWNGSQWSGLLGPNAGTSTDDNYLTAVAAISTNDAWAVGYYYDNAEATYRSLILRWNGSAWSIYSTNLTNGDNTLSAISVGSPNDIWAVGRYDKADGTSRTLAIHWNGSEWDWAPTPNAGSTTSDNVLSGVTALTDSNVWAVGNYFNTTSGRFQTLTLHWNGELWSAVTSPNIGTSHNFLYSIDHVSESNIWAVGRYYDTSISNYKTLIVRWYGTSWSVVTSPNPFGAGTNYLSSIAVTSPTDVWAVGYWAPTGNSYRTLSERFNPCPGPATSTPTNTATHTPTYTPTATNTPGGPTPTACPIHFQDVPLDSPYYNSLRCLACRSITSGYPCGQSQTEPCVPPNNYNYYRPDKLINRAQVARMVANAAGFNEPTGAQQYTDVYFDTFFFESVWRLTNRGLISGYPCGGPGEPCIGPNNLPYFRPFQNATRGQVAKLVSGAAGFSEPPGAPLFEDVPPSHIFHDYIQRLGNRGIVSGYECGHNVFEPCNPPNDLPYFHAASQVTRGQAANIIALAIFPGCSTP